jgi:hypothetical protein
VFLFSPQNIGSRLQDAFFFAWGDSVFLAKALPPFFGAAWNKLKIGSENRFSN